jgi:hypothetical protein
VSVAVARRVAALRADRRTVLFGFAGWLLVVERGPLVRLAVCEPTGLGDDFLVDLLSRHGGVCAEIVLVI